MGMAELWLVVGELTDGDALLEVRSRELLRASAHDLLRVEGGDATARRSRPQASARVSAIGCERLSRAERADGREVGPACGPQQITRERAEQRAVRLFPRRGAAGRLHDVDDRG